MDAGWVGARVEQGREAEAVAASGPDDRLADADPRLRDLGARPVTSISPSDEVLGNWIAALEDLLAQPSMLRVDLADPRQVTCFVVGMDATTRFTILTPGDALRAWVAAELGVAVDSLGGADQVSHALYGELSGSDALSADQKRDVSRRYVLLVLGFVRSSLAGD